MNSVQARVWRLTHNAMRQMAQLKMMSNNANKTECKVNGSTAQREKKTRAS